MTDFIEMESSPFDSDIIFDIQMKMMEFNRDINVDMRYSEEAKEKILRSRIFLDSARLLLKQLLEPEENDYIRDNKKHWDWMVDNLARYDQRLDKKEADTFLILERENGLLRHTKREGDDLSLISTDPIMNPTGVARVASYKRELLEAAEHLVYYPLKNAMRRFYTCEDKDPQTGLTIKKDKQLFAYFVFVYLYHTSQMFGAIARDENAKVPKNYTSTSLPTSGSGTEIIMPPTMPQNIRIETQDEAIQESVQDYFNVPKELLEDENV